MHKSSEIYSKSIVNIVKVPHYRRNPKTYRGCRSSDIIQKNVSLLQQKFCNVLKLCNYPHKHNNDTGLQLLIIIALLGEEVLFVNFDTVTIEDCIEMHDKKGCCTVINDGRIIEFRKENEK
jgi:hypothetical protein